MIRNRWAFWLGSLMVTGAWVAALWIDAVPPVLMTLNLIGGVLIVVGLAPGRLQNEDPRHRCYRGEPTDRS